MPVGPPTATLLGSRVSRRIPAETKRHLVTDRKPAASANRFSYLDSCTKRARLRLSSRIGRYGGTLVGVDSSSESTILYLRRLRYPVGSPWGRRRVRSRWLGSRDAIATSGRACVVAPTLTIWKSDFAVESRFLVLCSCGTLPGACGDGDVIADSSSSDKSSSRNRFCNPTDAGWPVGGSAGQVCEARIQPSL